MTSKDRTRQRLVGSMRKTKAAAGIDTATDVTEPAQVRAAKPSAGRSGKSAVQQNVGANGYQSGRRVWPD